MNRLNLLSKRVVATGHTLSTMNSVRVSFGLLPARLFHMSPELQQRRVRRNVLPPKQQDDNTQQQQQQQNAMAPYQQQYYPPAQPQQGIFTTGASFGQTVKEGFAFGAGVSIAREIVGGIFNVFSGGGGGGGGGGNGGVDI